MTSARETIAASATAPVAGRRHRRRCLALRAIGISLSPYWNRSRATH